MPEELKGPEGHYYRAPYPILSFLVGLYCDEAWSKAAFQKWQASERHTQVTSLGHPSEDIYLYDGYLDEYDDMPLAAARIISREVPKRPPEGAEQRRRPTTTDFAQLFPYLRRELCLPAGPRGSGKTFEFGPPVPTLNALGQIYLLDREPSPDWAKIPLPLLGQIYGKKGTIGVQPLLGDLQPILEKELTSVLCW